MQIAMSPARAGLVVAPYPVTERPLPLRMTGRQRLAVIRRWAGGLVEVLLVGLAVPAAILLVGLPIALLIGLLLRLASWL